MIGKIIGEKYILLEKIGRGGGGSVYKARDLRLGKQWAVKLLEHGKAQEAAVMKRLDHSMIPRIVDCLEEDGAVWLVMDYISGKNLMELHKKKGLSRRVLLGWAIDLCQVLSYLHSLKPPYIHGDLKPDNLVVSQEGKLFLVDFGAGAGRRSGICEGTPGFAAPEQSKGILTCQSDIYAFGKTWELLLGRRAGSDWKRILEKCCRQSPKRRYQQVEELEKRLRKIKRIRESRLLFLLLAGALSVSVAAGYAAGMDQPVYQMEGKEETAGFPGAEGEKETEGGENRWKELGSLAGELSRAAGLREKSDRKNGLRTAAADLKSFYDAEQQADRKLRAGLLLARAYREENCGEKAEEVYRELLVLYPDSAECYGSYGCMLLAEGAERKHLEEFYREGEQAVSDKSEYNYRIWTDRMKEMGD